MKEKDTDNNSIVKYVDTTSITYETDSDVTNKQNISVEREKYIASITRFLNQKQKKQSIDSLNLYVETAMEVFANNDSYDDKNFVAINDKLIHYVETQNELKVADSFYTAGLLESYGFFSIADGHPINNFKEGAKLGSKNCVKYLTIIYFERILYKHHYQEICDPVCMFHRARNYIEETSLANLNKNDILNFTKLSNSFLLKTISDHLNKKMSDDEILNYVLHLRTYSNPILNIDDAKFNEAYNSQNFDSENIYSSEQMDVFKKVLKQNKNIKNSDIAEMFTFNYPAYENDKKFLFWIKQDLDQKNIETFDEFYGNYNADSIYGYTDFLSNENLYTEILKYFAVKGDEKAQFKLNKH